MLGSSANCAQSIKYLLFIAIPQIWKVTSSFSAIGRTSEDMLVKHHFRGTEGHGSEEVQPGLGSSRYQREGILSVQAMEDGQDGRQNSGDTRNQQRGPKLPNEAEKG